MFPLGHVPNPMRCRNHQEDIRRGACEEKPHHQKRGHSLWWGVEIRVPTAGPVCLTFTGRHKSAYHIYAEELALGGCDMGSCLIEELKVDEGMTISSDTATKGEGQVASSGRVLYDMSCKASENWKKTARLSDIASFGARGFSDGAIQKAKDSIGGISQDAFCSQSVQKRGPTHEVRRPEVMSLAATRQPALASGVAVEGRSQEYPVDHGYGVMLRYVIAFFRP